MRALYLFLTLVCVVQALRVPFLHVSSRQLSSSQSSSSSSVSVCQICGTGSMMTPCSCAACSSSRSPSRIARRQQRLHMSTSATTEPSPGSPVVKNIDKNTNIATMAIALSGEQTQSAFLKSCELFNEEVKERGYKVAGFRQGAKLPPAYLYQMFGEDKVMMMLLLVVRRNCLLNYLLFEDTSELTLSCYVNLISLLELLYLAFWVGSVIAPPLHPLITH